MNHDVARFAQYAVRVMGCPMDYDHPEKTAIAVRLPDKSIDVSYLDGKSIREKYKILNSYCKTARYVIQ